ncbi:hypothetical protein P9B03_20185 [Metasolibacillus meyeri]|uniref:Uncharacterized protein n=1 Tax=Metasolibacillus meyeri TaxID=1071052 RepID=A0AAW9NYT5_9BACL|nr:hypothetical protein [Metasolibacillus meyeri]MEC1180776.1 hypothetical protein [Metasolibacillus meyeri]
MTYLQLFGVSIPTLWIAILATAFLLSIKLDDWFSNALFIYIIVWKFSYIFRWESIWGLLYFNGGIKGHWLGLISAGIYMILFAAKKYPSIKEQVSLSVLLYMYTFEAIFNVLQLDFLFAAIQVAIGCLILSLRKKLTWQWILLFFTIELLTLSLQHTLTLTKLFTFSTLLFILFIIKERKNG